MDNDLSFQGLIDYFEQRAARVERDANSYRHGDEPQYPPFFVFLGDDAIHNFISIAQNALDLWPQYSDCFRFVGVRHKEDGGNDAFEYCALRIDREGRTKELPLSEDGFADEFASLFEREDIFEKMTLAHMYYFIGTSSLKSVDEFDSLVEAIPHIQDMLQLDSTMARCSLTVLLNSDLRRRIVAKRIRARVADLSESMKEIGLGGVFLLSNNRNDGRLLRSWDECCRIVALYLALSNCGNSSIVDRMFDGKVLTASYAKVGKPTRSIGQLSLDVVLRALNDYSASERHDLFDKDDIKQRFGITKGGTFGVVDVDATQLLQAIVPKAEELRYFPQRTFQDYSNLQAYTYQSFDDECMGALSTYLEIRQRDQLLVDGTKMRDWVQAYGELLRENFSIDELIYLGDHMDEVRSLLGSSKGMAIAPGVIEGARDRLRTALSQNPLVIEGFVAQVQREADRANDFRSIWHDLLDSVVRVREVRNDKTLVAFYEQKARAFLRVKGRELGLTFSRQESVEGMKAFLEGAINDLIDSDEVYAAPFYEELIQRLNVVNDGADAFKWIYSNLTDASLQTYLQVNFALDDPITKSVFVEEGTELEQRLARALTSQTHFYNTGNSRWVEAINIHVVDAGNLLQ